MNTTSGPKGNIGSVVTGIILITVASTFLLFQMISMGFRFLELSDKILLSSVSVSFEEQKLQDEKVVLDEFSNKVNKTNALLGKAMEQSLQWSDSVQHLMESSLDNMETIQEIYEQHILPGEETIDSLSALFDKFSDSLLVKMEQYNLSENSLRQSKIIITGLKEKRFFTISVFIVVLILFAGFFISGFSYIKKGG